MMWTITSSIGSAVELSAPTAMDAARLYASTHGLGSALSCVSVSEAGIGYEVDGVSLTVSRKGWTADSISREAVDLHSKLGLSDSDESYDIIHGVLDRIAGYPDYDNYN